MQHPAKQSPPTPFLFQATSHYLRLLRAAVGNALFLQILSVHPTPALTIVLDTSASSQVQEAVIQAVTRLEDEHSSQEYPPEEYLLVLYGRKGW